MATHAAFVICLICWVIIHLILLPYESYWCYQFWKQRNELIITKREPVLVIIVCYAPAIFICISMTAIMIQDQFTDCTPDDSNLFQAGGMIHDCFLLPFLWIASLAGVNRYWILFFRISHNVAVLNNKWQSVLDPNIGKTNWYLQNITKWGSFRYLRKWLLVYFIIGCLFTVPLTHIIPDPPMVMTIICWSVYGILMKFIPILVGVYIACKLPSFKDDIGIRKEEITCLYIMLLIIISWLVNVGLPWILNFSRNASQIKTYIWLLYFKSLGTALTVRSTRSVLKTFASILNGRSSSSSMMTLAHRQTFIELERIQSESQQEDTSDINTRAMNIQNELKNALKNQLLFDGFMEHLFNEYSAECLLSIAEFVQFKNKIREELKDSDLKDEEEMDIELPQKMVKSKIVYGNDDNYQSIALNLYEKYIQIEGEWEININYRDRHKYLTIFEGDHEDGITEDTTKLYTIFDDCINEMRGLLLASFTRFKVSKQYQMLNKKSLIDAHLSS